MTRLRLALALVCAGSVTAAGGWYLSGAGPASAASPRQLTPEEMVPANIMPLAPATAAEINARQPLMAGANPAATPFRAAFNGDIARMRSIDCLTQAIYYEAGMEPVAGQKAVAQVVLNRVAHVAYPNSVCGVVYQGSHRRTGCQFTFTCDGALARRPEPSRWAQARRVAEAALAGEVYAPVGYSTHYHANYVVPYWAPTLRKTAVIGAHIFYRSAGNAGSRAAFSARYAGVEPVVSGRTTAAVAAADSAKPQYVTLSLDPAAPDGSKLPEERAAEIDSFGLLDFRKPAAADAAASKPVGAAEQSAMAAVSSALSGARAPAAAGTAPMLEIAAR